MMLKKLISIFGGFPKLSVQMYNLRNEKI